MVARVEPLRCGIRLAAWRRGLACLGVWSMFAAPSSAASTEIVILDRAKAVLQPAGLPAREEDVKLSHRWDQAFPGRDGSAVYRLALPAQVGADPMALLFSRVGNQVSVRVNGTVVAQLGTLGQASFDAAKTSWMVVIPASLLRSEGASELEVKVTAQASRWGGLSVVKYGPLSGIRAEYDSQRSWRYTALIVLAAGFLMMSLASFALWYRQREALYGWFALAAALGVVRHLDRVWPDVPVPWPVWGAVVAAAYGLHQLAMFRVASQMLGQPSMALSRAMWGTAAIVVVMAAAAFLESRPALWTAGLLAIMPYGIAVVAQVVKAALKNRQVIARILLAAAFVAVLAGVHDFAVVRVGLSAGANFSLMPFVTFAIALIMAGLIVQRYNRVVFDYRQLNTELADRIAVREDQLRTAFHSLEVQHREQAILEERQRMMREIHDGVGAQLVGLLNLSSEDRAKPEVINEQVKMALDEMRMAVDSLQPMHGDLTTVLATLRYRLQPRLESAGIEVAWDVESLPPLEGLSAQVVLQVQRILLEAFTNVLKHARATRIVIAARCDGAEPHVVRISLVDDGIGIWAETTGGQPGLSGRGLGNMRARAQAIGAHVTISRVEPQGTSVELRFPTGLQTSGS